MTEPATSRRPRAATDVLFEPIKIGTTTLANRVALAPMTRVSADESGHATERMLRYYRGFARGGFGLLVTEGVYTDTEYSQGYLNQPGLATTKHADAWRPVVDAVHDAGAAVYAQLMHAGAQSQGNRYRRGTVGPSAVAPRGHQLAMYRGAGPYPSPEALTVRDMRSIRRGFVAAAQHAAAAGFDGVELHGANGYLLDEFLTGYLNRRDDSYGGSTANRVRYAAEVCEEVMQAVGADMTVGIRISQTKVSDTEHRWAGGSEDARVIFSALAETGVHFLHTTEYQATRPAFADQPHSLAAFAAAHGGVTVIANGRLDDPETARSILGSGADVVALGKAALAHRDWPVRVRHGRPVQEELPADLLAPLADLKAWEVEG